MIIRFGLLIYASQLSVKADWSLVQQVQFFYLTLGRAVRGPHHAADNSWAPPILTHWLECWACKAEDDNNRKPAQKTRAGMQWSPMGVQDTFLWSGNLF